MSLHRFVGGILQERVAPLTAAGAVRRRRIRELAEREGTGDEFCLDQAKRLETWRRRLKTVLRVLTVMLGSRTKR